MLPHLFGLLLLCLLSLDCCFIFAGFHGKIRMQFEGHSIERLKRSQLFLSESLQVFPKPERERKNMDILRHESKSVFISLLFIHLLLNFVQAAYVSGTVLDTEIL